MYELLSYDALYKLAEEHGFSLGAVIDYGRVYSPGYTTFVKKHFNSMSAGNEMKAYALLDHDACMENAKTGDGMPRMNYKEADKIMDFAKENDIKMRGHTLVWREHMADWFFREGYEADGNYVSREVMLERLESYIKQVLTHFQEKYPGVIYAWDVVNEAIAADWSSRIIEGDSIVMNDDDLFYCHIGTDYVQKAFEYANKYADKDVKLFYNDYGGDHPYRRKAIINLVKIVNAKEKLIDGIGYQGYNDYDVSVLQSYPDKDNSSVVDALSDFYELGLEIHITEFTISNEDESYNNAQGEFMYRFMELIKEFNKDNNIITNVTIWGIQDSPNIQPEDYGYPGFRYSGIITEDYQPKESFDGLYKSLKSK